VLGTVLGASAGLAVVSIPDVFDRPLLMLLSLAAASVALGLMARKQARTGIMLAELTLCAVALCTYESASCCGLAMSPVHVFVARMASVTGGCVYVMLLSRLLWPWRLPAYVLEQLADALEHAMVLFAAIYHSQHERMRLSELVAEAQAAGGSGEADEAPAGAASEAVEQAAQQQLAQLEAAEAQLHVRLRQDVRGPLIAMQLLVARDSVSWQRGAYATPLLVLNMLAAMADVVSGLSSQRLSLAPFTRQAAAAAATPAAAADASSAAAHGMEQPARMLHTMRHCYSSWAAPLHPFWLKVRGWAPVMVCVLLRWWTPTAPCSHLTLRRTHAGL
jgi:hypothetical protein